MMTKQRFSALVILLLGIGMGAALMQVAPEPETIAPTPQTINLWSPQPQAPADGFTTYPTDITLQWGWDQPLAENQLFTVRFWREGSPPADITWTKETQITITDALESNPPGRFYWQVAVIQLDANGAFQGMASGWSPVWQLERIPPTPLPTQTPPPTQIYLTPTPDPKYTNPNPYDSPENDVASLISFATAAEAEAKRQEVIEILWGAGNFPAEVLPTVETNIPDPAFAEMDNLRQIDKLTIRMELGIESYAYLFHPLESNGELMIYHQGSDGEFTLGMEAIQFFLSEGYSVMAFAMPLLGINNHPVVDIPRLGTVRLPGYLHFHVYFLEPLIENGIALKLFVEPVIVGLNYAETLNFEAYHMLGISGGGWTTHMVAAIDPRVSHSYPVAGSVPLFQRFDGRAAQTDLLAYVQLLPRLFPAVNYEELYLLGGLGEGRKEMMVINQYDSCCFWGVRYEVWYPVLQERMAQLGAGEFEVFLDSSHQAHIISPLVLETILADLQK